VLGLTRIGREHRSGAGTETSRRTPDQLVTMHRLARNLEQALDGPLGSLERRQRPAAANEEELVHPRERATNLDATVALGPEKPLEIVPEPRAREVLTRLGALDAGL